MLDSILHASLFCRTLGILLPSEFLRVPKYDVLVVKW